MLNDVLQYLVNGLIVGALISLPALGLTLIFSVLGFVNFSIAAQVTAGAYAGWLANRILHLELIPVLICSFVIAGTLGVIVDGIALAPVRRRPGAQTPLLVAVVSIALNMALENVYRFCFGNDLNSFDIPIARDLKIGIIRIGLQQLHNLEIAIGLAVILALFFSVTRLGKAMRAVADNVDLARLKGIETVRLGNLATFIGMGLAGIGGALLAIDTSVDPSTGSKLILLIFAASVVGGLTSLPGAVLGALLIGVTGELGLLVLPPVYQPLTAFIMILITLLARPTGIFSISRGTRK